MKKHTWKIVLGVAVLLMGGSFALAQYVGDKANEGVTVQSHVKGNIEATVKLTEYADFQCPACGQFYSVLKSIEEEYGDELAMEYRHFPLVSIHALAIPAAKAAEAAGQQGKFFEMHDKLYENQDAWSTSATPQVYFNEYAEELGLDMALFKRHMRASVLEDAIKSQFAEARSLGLSSTPTFYLNDERLEFQTMGEFIEAIESALGVVTASSTQETETKKPVEFGIPAV